MSKKSVSQRSSRGWKYHCSCGYETLSVGDAVSHVNKNKGHQLTRVEI